MPHQAERSASDPLAKDQSGRLALRTFRSVVEEDIFVYKFGSNDAASATLETMWTAGAVKTWTDSDVEMFIASDNAADTSVHVIAQVVDQNYVQRTVEVTTDAVDGRTPVSIGQAISINRGRLRQDATGNVWGGYGTFTDGVPATPEMHIPAGHNATFHGFYTVPSRIDGYKYPGTWNAVLMGVSYSSNVDVEVLFRARAVGVEAWWTLDRQYFNGTGVPVRFDAGMPGQLDYLFGPGTQFELLGRSLTGLGSLGGRFTLRMVRADLA